MNEHPRNLDEQINRDIAEQMERLNRTSGDPEVDRPAHYVADDGSESMDFIESFKLGFHEGCIVQYVIRWPKKGGIKDLYKARNLLDRLIAIAEAAR